MNTVRIVFSKTGRAKYISHLDLNRCMIRAVRRAEIPLWYTEGFNRHPYVTFASPLSLGFEGLRETMDIRLEADMPMEELVQRMNAVMPEGLKILSAAPAIKKTADVARSRYRITLGCPLSSINAFLQQEEIIVDKRTKKKDFKKVNLKPILNESDLLLEPTDGGTELKLTLPSGSSLSVNPALIVDALQKHAGLEELPASIQRLEVYACDGEPFR